jgi:hypothetical protein
MGSYKGDAFGDQVSISVDKMLGNMNKVIQETTVELYSSVIDKTPVKRGDAKNSWGVSINIPYNTGGGITAGGDSGMEETVRAKIINTKLEDNYYLVNATPYILLLENGGYDGIPEHKSDPYPPWYPASKYPRPFKLLTEGDHGPISKKAPKGMVKVTMLKASDVFNDMVTKYGGK